MGIARALDRIRSYRRTVNELSNLRDRDLADLGISRSDIPAIARQASRTAA